MPIIRPKEQVDFYYMPNKCKYSIPIGEAPVSAGRPASVNTEDYGYLDVNAHVTQSKDTFLAFVVKGNSMVENFQDGDIVFADTACPPKHGDTVIASVDGMIFIKIFHQKQRLYLVSNNPEYPDREIAPEQDFQVVGVVKGFVRTM